MPERDNQALLKVNTSRFGEIEIPVEQVVTMPNGVIGFPHLHRYVFIKHREGSPFHWLQSLEEPSLAFVVMNPLIFDPQYEFTLGKAETKLLELDDPEQIQVWVLVTIPHGAPERMTANLKAPLVVNLATGLAAQVILEDPRFPLRHPIRP
jgi:flagellar assembly factor FliW